MSFFVASSFPSAITAPHGVVKPTVAQQPLSQPLPHVMDKSHVGQHSPSPFANQPLYALSSAPNMGNVPPTTEPQLRAVPLPVGPMCVSPYVLQPVVPMVLVSNAGPQLSPQPDQQPAFDVQAHQRLQTYFQQQQQQQQQQQAATPPVTANFEAPRAERTVDVPRRCHPPEAKQLLVNFIAPEATPTGLAGLFAEYGVVDLVRIIKSKSSDKSKGYGFVYFQRAEDASAALQALHKKDYLGRKIRVTVASPQKPLSRRALANIAFRAKRRESAESDVSSLDSEPECRD